MAKMSAAVGHEIAPPPSGFAPYARPQEEGFGVSLKLRGGALQAMTLYAHSTALPDDDALIAAWTADMNEEELRAFTLACAGVRALSAGAAGRHQSRLSALAWTVEADGTWHRAASLRVPPLCPRRAEQPRAGCDPDLRRGAVET